MEGCLAQTHSPTEASVHCVGNSGKRLWLYPSQQGSSGSSCSSYHSHAGSRGRSISPQALFNARLDFPKWLLCYLNNTTSKHQILKTWTYRWHWGFKTYNFFSMCKKQCFFFNILTIVQLGKLIWDRGYLQSIENWLYIFSTIYLKTF